MMIEQSRARLAAATAERAELSGALTDRITELAAARAALPAARASDSPAHLAEAAERVRELTRQRAEAARALSALDEQVRLDLDALLSTTLSLEADLPLVLLPVRIETRSTTDCAALRVRIYHDTLHSESLEEGLSDAERVAGIAYWTTIWADESSTETAWRELLAATGPRRAPWVAEALSPRNADRRPDEPPDFPATLPRTGRPSAARTLPDRFYVRLEQAGSAPVTVSGNVIPGELATGLSDRDELTPLQVRGMDLPPMDESLRWLVDYDEAVRVGMAVTVPLPQPGMPVRRLLVYGVRAAIDGAAGAVRLERLIRSHRFTDGAEFLAQGTPTNNTEDARSGWRPLTPPGPRDLAAATPAPDSNAAVTATALGISAAVTGALVGAELREQPAAAAFHTALWATTWGDAIEHLTPAGRANGDKRLHNRDLDAVREHWVQHVRGRGPLPALRLGRQPYGLLPVVVTGPAWRPQRRNFIEDRLVPFLDQQVRWMWTAGVDGVPTVHNRPLDEALPQILGTDAVLRGLRVRTALSPDPIVRTAMALTLPDLGDTDSSREITTTLLLLAGVADSTLDDHDLLGSKTRALALPLAHESDPEFIGVLLADEAPDQPPRSVLQVLLAHAMAIEEHGRKSVVQLDRPDMLRGMLDTSSVEFDHELVSQAITSLIDGERAGDLVSTAAEHLADRVGRLDSRQLADRNPITALASSTAIEQVAGPDTPLDRLTGPIGMQLIGEWLLRETWGTRFRAAIETIAETESVDGRRLLLAETLDCCSHRLDAWIGSAAARRLGDLRDNRPAGAYLGAYGWLENIEIRAPASAGSVDGRPVLHDGADGGFVHAPGLTHAAAAAVLRSGRLTHRRGDPSADALDIDLSSERTRDALALLDGMRQGQSLGAMLGYRLERRLHERSGTAQGLELDRFIYVLRGLAPLRAGKLTEPGAPVHEGLAASTVVDGLRLLAVDPKTVRQKLIDGPTDNKFMEAWVPPQPKAPDKPDEADAVLAEIAALEHAHDAVADLLLAESVFQLVSGNPARAAAVLDALGSGEAVPPEPEVARTSRTGIPIQHRVAIVVADPPPKPSPGWSGFAPRALAEPRLEAWAQGALPDPTTIPIVPDQPLNLAYGGLSALDMIYDSDGDSVAASTLVRRLRARFSDRDLGHDFSPLAPYWELAEVLRGQITSARPLDIADLGRRVAATDTGRSADIAEFVARARSAVKMLAAAATAVDPEPTLLGYGVQVSATPGAQADPGAVRSALVAAAGQRVSDATAALDRITDATAPTSAAELAAEAMRAVFGAEFIAVPILGAPLAGEADLWADALGPAAVSPRPGADIRPWLERAGRIRERTSAYGESLLVREAFGVRPRLRVAQSPAGAYPSWVGLSFPGGRPPMVPLTSTIAEVAGAPTVEPTGAVAGLVIDEWIEVLPRRLERGDPTEATELVDVTTTAVALNANAPGARPPQAILLALSADGTDWDEEKLVAVLDETMALTRMRPLTLQQLPYAGRYLPALYFHNWSLQGEPVIDWVKAATEFDSVYSLDFLEVD